MWNREIKIDRIHSRAITDEIGERLRMAHSLVSPELPPRIQRQLDQLRELDREESPSIVPSSTDFEEIHQGEPWAVRFSKAAPAIFKATQLKFELLLIFPNSTTV